MNQLFEFQFLCLRDALPVPTSYSSRFEFVFGRAVGKISKNNYVIGMHRSRI